MKSQNGSGIKVLVLNAGSSSHKAALYGERLLWKGHVEWKENFRDARMRHEEGPWQEISLSSTREGLDMLLSKDLQCDVVGHRVVHGGERFQQTTRITPEVKQEIASLTDLAPLHNPVNLEGIEMAEKRFPDVPQFAVFDTAFHSTLPQAAYTYPGPYAWREQGIRRYGFHGISHAYCSQKAADTVGKPLISLKMVVCHLGAGASLCAVKEGKSIDTTMGFTPIEGVMMASRSGSVDPGLLLYLLSHGVSAKSLEHTLNHDSGLLGISGISEDMRDILAHQDSPRVQLAYTLFIHRLCRELGGMVASLGGLDVLVFTAGIGENCAPVREAVSQAFSFLGVEIDLQKNEAQETKISTPSSSVDVLIIPTQEEWEIAQECRRQLS